MKGAKIKYYISRVSELEAVVAKQKEATGVAVRLLDNTLTAIVDMLKIIAEKGGPEGLQFIGDWMNNCDAVGEGDPEIWEAALKRLSAAESALKKGPA